MFRYSSKAGLSLDPGYPKLISKETLMVYYRVADPSGVDTDLVLHADPSRVDLDPTLKKTTEPDPTLEKHPDPKTLWLTSRICQLNFKTKFLK